MPSKPKQLFLCHSHADKPFVRKLARDLSVLGINVWMDEWELEPGDSLHGVIGEALSSVAYVGVILSPDSVSSVWCQSELDQALTREKATKSKIVIPLLYRRVAAPPFLAGRLYVDFSRSYFGALTQVGGFLNGLPARELTDAMDRARPGTIADAIACLESAGWKGIRYVKASDYDRLRETLRKLGVSRMPDEFEIVVRPAARASGKASAMARRAKPKRLSRRFVIKR
jgi:TIR domain-containing protein